MQKPLNGHKLCFRSLNGAPTLERRLVSRAAWKERARVMSINPSRLYRYFAVLKKKINSHTIIRTHIEFDAIREHVGKPKENRGLIRPGVQCIIDRYSREQWMGNCISSETKDRERLLSDVVE